jgi:DNA gyrase subunit A
MRLQRLAGLERKKVLDELDEVQKLIGELKEILGSEKKVRALIKLNLPISRQNTAMNDEPKS